MGFIKKFITPQRTYIDCNSITLSRAVILCQFIPVSMAAIKNLNGLTVEQVNNEIRRGGRFVMYQYTVSLLIITLQRSSDIYFISSEETSAGRGLPFTVVSLVFGWWGIPWGPIRTISSIACNLSGGKDVTQEVLSLMDSLENGKRIPRKVA